MPGAAAKRSGTLTAGQRFALRWTVSLGVYGLVFLAARPFAQAGASSAVRLTLALVLALSTLAAMGAIARYLVEEGDEYLRMRQAQAVLWGAGLTIALYTLWGYLGVFRLAPPLAGHFIFPVFSAGWLLAVVARKALGR